MLLKDELKEKLAAIEKKFSSVAQAINIQGKKNRIDELAILQSDPNLYGDLKKAQAINTEAKNLTDAVKSFDKLASSVADSRELVNLTEDSDNDMLAALASDIDKLEETVEKTYLSTLLTGEYDSHNAIINIHAGAGGTEASDWAKMLYRMYQMYCSNQGYSFKELDYIDGDEAGLKSVTFLVSGLNAYGYLKAEKGVHRLVRISPFDSNARRHTSFASVEAMPEIASDTEVTVNPDELRIDTYRSSGAGGQHVNKTDSAIRITHLSTGIVVQCQNERSQIQNRETAMSMLRAKLVERRERENAEKAQNIQGSLKKIEWGSQIRSYVFHPYSMVKDHRTSYETGNVSAVMDGDIQPFINEYLRRSNA